MTDAFCIRELISLAARSTRMKNVMETEARSSVTEQTNTIRRMHERRAGSLGGAVAEWSKALLVRENKRKI